VKDYAELARLGRVSASRVSQILLLLHLAPAIQETILFLDTARAHLLTEKDLHRVAREPNWDRQRVLFEKLMRPN